MDFESILFFTKEPKYYFEQQLEQYTQPLDRWGGDKLVANGIGMWDTGTGQTRANSEFSRLAYAKAKLPGPDDLAPVERCSC